MVKNFELSVDRVQRISSEVVKMIRERCKDPVEGLYVLKACLYLLRCAVKSAGIFIDNEAQLDDELIRLIEKSIEDEGIKY